MDWFNCTFHNVDAHYFKDAHVEKWSALPV